MEEEHKKEESEKLEDKANEKEKKSLIEKIKSALSPVKKFLLGIGTVLLKLWKPVKIICEWIMYIWKMITNRKCLTFYTFILALGTIGMAICTRETVKDNQVLINSNNEMVRLTRQTVQDNRELIESNNKMVDLTSQANSRAAKLFVGQNKPLIDVTPIGIIPGIADDGNKMCATVYSILNYSGFDANNISVDIAYEGNVYISEWLRAEKDSKRKEKERADPNVVIGKFYPSRPDVQIKELKSGQAKEHHQGTNGSLDLDKRVVGTGKKGFPVMIRVTWENDQGHVFEEIHKYKLLCTTAEDGHAFTFIPEGIISQKN